MRQILIILGRPFLATANANINCRTGVMDVSFGNMKVWMNIYRASQHPPMEEADCCAVALMEDPLEACLAHFSFDEYDIDHSIEEVNALLGKTTPFIDRHPWYAKFEPVPRLAESSALPSVESPP